MKKVNIIIAAVALVVMSSCHKDECHDCHYDGPNGEVELGEYSGQAAEDLENTGYTDSTGTTYTVHCGEH